MSERERRVRMDVDPFESPGRLSRNVERESVEDDPLSSIFDAPPPMTDLTQQQQQQQREEEAEVENTGQDGGASSSRASKTMTPESFASSFLKHEKNGYGDEMAPRNVKIGSSDDVCGDVRTVRKRVVSGMWLSALNIAKRALSMSSIYGEQQMELKVHEIRALVRLGRYEEAAKICDAKDPSTDLALPFSVRVTRAELSHWLDPSDTQETISSLQRLLVELKSKTQIKTDETSCRLGLRESLHVLLDTPSALGTIETLSPSHRILWRRHIIQLLAKYSSLLPIGGVERAMKYVEDLVQEASQDVDVVSSKRGNARLYMDSMLLAARILNRVGNVSGASKIHAELQSALSPNLLRCAHRRVAWSTHLMSQSRYADALRELESVLSSFGADNRFRDDVVREEMIATVINNLAVAALHCCQIRRAVACLEDFLRGNAQSRMHPTLVFNLCTLYDVAFSSDVARTRKEGLRIVDRKLGVANDPKVFRLG